MKLQQELIALLEQLERIVARSQAETTKSTEPTVEYIYGKPLSELEPPWGFIFTGEFRVPRLKVYAREWFLGVDGCLYNSFQFSTSLPHLLLKYKASITVVYGKPLVELSPPKGHLFTGEFRVPEVGEPFLASDGISTCIYHSAAWAPRLILQKEKK